MCLVFGFVPDDFFVATLSCHGKLWRLATCILDFKVSKAIRLGVNKVFAEMLTHIERVNVTMVGGERGDSSTNSDEC